MKNTFFFLLMLLFSVCLTDNHAKANVSVFYDLKQNRDISGKIIDKKSKKSINKVKVKIKELGIETYTNINGEFIFLNIPPKKLTLVIEHAEYQSLELQFDKAENILGEIELTPNVLEIKEVLIVGVKGNKEGATSTIINRKAIEHLQASSLQEVLQFSPGNLVTNPNFTNTNQANIRQYNSDNLGSLGTSLVINGLTISNNANLQAINTATSGTGASFSTSSGGGADMRMITADNIESVEVIRGVPSVEYGDLNSGAVIVKTKAIRDPLQIKARFNPVLTQFWTGKGFDIGENRGTLYVDLDYTKSNDNETNKYRKYQRATGTIQYTNRFGKDKKWHNNSTLSFGYARDLYDMDPDFVEDSLKTNSTDKYLRFISNNTINFNKKFSRNLKYTIGVSYNLQKGYQQQYYTADITTESYALQNSTNEVPYLPSSYMSKMWVDGKPLNLSAKVSNQFYFLTGIFNHNIIAGLEWKMDANYGDGKTFTRPIRNTSGAAYRARAYKDIPALHQTSAYIQDRATGSFGNYELDVVAGVRFDAVQPFTEDYSLNALSPRINFALKTPHRFTIRGAYGITSKAPTLLYLYPENAYFDFYSLNYYASNPAERLALISTRVYNSQNVNLKLAKTQKYELGIDFSLDKENKKKLYITAYHERTKNGYSMSTTLESVRFANYPAYTVASQIPGQKPALSSVVNNKTNMVSYYAPSNNIDRINKGIEFELDLGKIRVINTSFNLNGAYVNTKSVTNSPYILQQNIGGRPTTRVGVFAAGRGTEEERFVTTLRAIHHIPELRFIITLSAQTTWLDQNKYIGYDPRPIGYIPYNTTGSSPHIVYLTEHQRQAVDPINDADIYLNINEATYVKEKWKPLWLFNIKLTKEFRNGINFSFFANNFINNRPLEAGTRYPSIYEKRNIAFFFGSEISIKL